MGGPAPSGRKAREWQEQTGCEGPFPERPLGGARARGSVKRAFCPSARPVVGRRGGKIRARRRGRSLYELALLPGVAVGMEEDEGADEQQQLSYRQVEENRVPAGLGEDGAASLNRKSPGGRGRASLWCPRPTGGGGGAPRPTRLPRWVPGGGFHGNAGWMEIPGEQEEPRLGVRRRGLAVRLCDGLSLPSATRWS